MQPTEMEFEKIVSNYKPMIKKQLQSLNLYKDYEDYYQVALIALWEAYQKFDPERGIFSTFAIATVRGRLLTM